MKKFIYPVVIVVLALTFYLINESHRNEQARNLHKATKKIERLEKKIERLKEQDIEIMKILLEQIKVVSLGNKVRFEDLANKIEAIQTDKPEVEEVEEEIIENLNETQSLFNKLVNDKWPHLLNHPEYKDLPEAEKKELEADWLDALNNPNNRDEYYNAINCLAEIKSEAAVQPLLEIAAVQREKDNRDRWMATRALGIIGDKSVIPELIPLVYHYNQDTRIFAQISLVRMTGENFGADWEKWGFWWNNNHDGPEFSFDLVEWATSSRMLEYADPIKQRETDQRFVDRMKRRSR